MKFFPKFLLTIYLPLIRLTSEIPNIVFVHIGEKIPTHATTALRQARLFNEFCPIYFVAPKSVLLSLKQEDNNYIGVAVETLIKTEHCKNFVKLSKRQGIWRYSIERFFYLQALVKTYNLKHVFHLENDVMLYADLDQFMAAIEKYHYDTWVIADSDKRCIASLIYFKDLSALDHFTQFLVDHATESCNDMDLIAKYKSTFGKQIGQLPLIFQEYLKDFPLQNKLGQIVITPQSYCKHYNDFNCIFDAAAIGQYLGGLDPIIKNPSPGFINETCVFNPSHFTYEWQHDKKWRYIPFARYKNCLYKIANLHIHSKRLHEFESCRN